MGNLFYESYVKKIEELEELVNQYDGTLSGAKKLKGAVTTELIKQQIVEYFMSNGKNYKVSNVNSYIAGSKWEYDLLIVKDDSEPFLGQVYRPEDVIAIIECKANGLYNLKSDPKTIINAANCAIELNENIKFGYITMSENVPVNEYKKDGSATVKQWDITQKLLGENIKGKTIIYAVTLYRGKKGNKLKIYEEGSDEEFIDFVNYLIEDDVLDE